MKNKLRAEEYYKFFSTLPGNKHIANLFAIEKTLDILSVFSPKNILEVGLGIGSISYSIMDFFNHKQISFNYYGTENNEFCLKALQENLGNYYHKLKVFSSINELKKTKYFNFVIIDGSDESLQKVSQLISDHGIIFIEGDRKNQQQVLLNLFPKHKFVHTISNYKEPDYGPFKTGDWSGGGKLIFINPTVKQNLFWLKEKFKSSYRNRVTRKLQNS